MAISENGTPTNNIHVYMLDSSSEKDSLPVNKIVNGVPKVNSDNIFKKSLFMETGSLAICSDGTVFWFNKDLNEWTIY